MDHTDLDTSLAKMFGSQMSMAQALEIVDLPTNEEKDANEPIPLTLLLKPFGFKPPPPKTIIPRLLQAWNIRKGVSIAPKKYADDILVCVFKDKKDMLFVERDRAWSVQGAHLMTARWDKGKSLEEIPFDSVTFWVQLRGIPLEMLSKKNITRILGHDQAHCASETPPNPNLYGPWLRFDPQSDLPPPQATLIPPENLSLLTDNNLLDPVTHSRPHCQISISKNSTPDNAQSIKSPPSIGEDNQETRQSTDLVKELSNVGTACGSDPSSNFLRRGQLSPRKKTTRTTQNNSQVICTDTLYSGLIDLQDQAQAHFSDNWSPSHQSVPSEAHRLPCKPSAQPNPPV
ncbi:hypothetical protein CDL15_Pgr013112 [Punica granatum]|uniref:Uncharacterized protein n=1 Tax=Punica granatum TaxID=22663 RepID=A0A218WIH1_PUNGR|nr:hypothetical protein CDL15_Pgr013112 [Punica granatum]